MDIDTLLRYIPQQHLTCNVERASRGELRGSLEPSTASPTRKKPAAAGTASAHAIQWEDWQSSPSAQLRTDGGRANQELAVIDMRDRCQREAADVIRNKVQQPERRKRRGIDLPWGGPRRVRHKKRKAQKTPQPQLGLSFLWEQPLQYLFPETHAATV